MAEPDEERATPHPPEKGSEAERRGRFLARLLLAAAAAVMMAAGVVLRCS